MPSTPFYTLSLHDALPISTGAPVPTNDRVLIEGFDRYIIIHTHFGDVLNFTLGEVIEELFRRQGLVRMWWWDSYRILYEMTAEDRKSTRLNSSHVSISYAVHPLLHSFPTRRSSDLHRRTCPDQRSGSDRRIRSLHHNSHSLRRRPQLHPW